MPGMTVNQPAELTSAEYADLYGVDADALEALIGTDLAELSTDDLESIAALDDLDVPAYCGAFAGFHGVAPPF